LFLVLFAQTNTTTTETIDVANPAIAAFVICASNILRTSGVNRLSTEDNCGYRYHPTKPTINPAIHIVNKVVILPMDIE
jgi:hypothetical protein